MTDMQITMTSTPEQHEFVINGVAVPARVWTGQTAGGVPVEVYVLSVVPPPDSEERFKAEVPAYMRRSRDTFTIG